MGESSEMSKYKKTRRHVADMIYDAASRAASSKAVESHLNDLPALSLYTFATSIMALGNRIVKLGKMEIGISEFMSWQRPAMTITILYAFSILCYHPQWIVMLPLFYFFTFLLVPNYYQKFLLDSEPGAPPTDLFDIPVGENEDSGEDEKKTEARNLLVAVRQGQMMLSNIVDSLDRYDQFINGPVKFSDPQISCIMLLGVLGALLLGGYALTFVSIPFFFSSLAWTIVCSKHPLAKLTTEKLEDLCIEPELDLEKLKNMFVSFCRRVVLVDDSPLCRIVEIFELQPQGLTARQWDESRVVFSNNPYIPGSSARVMKKRPQGVNMLSDVLPPSGWYFDVIDDWAVDNEPISWVSSKKYEEALLKEQINTDESWVYDHNDDSSDTRNEIVWKRRRLTRKCYRDFM